MSMQLKTTYAMNRTHQIHAINKQSNSSRHRISCRRVPIVLFTNLKGWHFQKKNDKSAWQQWGGIKNFLLRHLVMERLMGRPTLFPGLRFSAMPASTHQKSSLEPASCPKPAEAYCTFARLLPWVHKIETGHVSANYDKIFWGTNCKTNDILRSH